MTNTEARIQLMAVRTVAQAIKGRRVSKDELAALMKDAVEKARIAVAEKMAA